MTITLEAELRDERANAIWLSMKAFFLTIATAMFATVPAYAEEFSASAIVTFNKRMITDTKVSGMADPFTKRSLTPDDPVRVASVSKLIVALGVMRLVDAGTLNLDRDVSDYLGWRLRNPAFPNMPITLRLLLSHRSSLTDNVDYIIPAGGSVQASTADAKAWDAAHPPGEYFRYTNLNFPVIASVMEAATGERFDALMARLVFKPLKLDACFNWTTCSDAAVARAVVLTDGVGAIRRDHLQGKRPACPTVPAADGVCDLSRYKPGINGGLFSPQGGLRISAQGLATIGQMLLRRGRGFISARSYKTLVTPLWGYDGTNGETEGGFWCSYALAVQTLSSGASDCKDDPFGDGRRRIGHPGEAYGLRSGLWIDPATGKGTAYFITAVADDAAKGRSAFNTVEEALLQGRK
jgi:CubicO group peptidase (beta-lactamase class C family)